MPDDISADRVSAIASAARVPLVSSDAARIARAVAPTAARFARAKIELSFPESLCVQRTSGWQRETATPLLSRSSFDLIVPTT